MFTGTQVPDFKAEVVNTLVVAIAVHDQLQLQSWGTKQRWPLQAGQPMYDKSERILFYTFSCALVEAPDRDLTWIFPGKLQETLGVCEMRNTRIAGRKVISSAQPQENAHFTRRSVKPTTVVRG